MRRVISQRYRCVYRINGHVREQTHADYAPMRHLSDRLSRLGVPVALWHEESHGPGIQDTKTLVGTWNNVLRDVAVED